MSKIFNIKEKSLFDFSLSLNVPSYQRPYCWGKEEIEKILSDFNDNREKDIYFIGNIISIKLKNENKYDLIDGQQRITTLCILCLYLYYQNQNQELLKFCKKDENPMINFAIRDNTNEYLKELLHQVLSKDIDKKDFWNLQQFLPNENDKKAKNDPTFSQNLNIANAFKIIHNWFEDTKKNKNKLFDDEFLLKKVRFKFLIAPENTPENNLFIQINTNGTQFQHYDILKAELVNSIRDEQERTEFAKKWDWASENFYSKYVPEKLDDNDVENEVVLQSLIDEAKKETYYDVLDQKKVTIDYRFQYIIDFNTLLLHSLFIFCKKNKDDGFSNPESFNSEHLLNIFKDFRSKLSDEISKGFINILFKLKEIMIDFIIFRDLDQNGFNFITKAQKEINDDDSETDDQIEEEKKAPLAQFQRMLYHSSNSTNHFWLGIFLDQYFNNRESVSLELLEKIENIISIEGNTFKTYQSYFSDSKEFLSKNHFFPEKFDFTYHNISRYWFYKLEYLLWKQSSEPNSSYTIVSRTSIEHIIPQTNKDGVDYVYNDINIHSFGNLVLITVSENSGFSNQNLLEKWNYKTNNLSNPPLKMNLFFNDLEKMKLIKDILSKDDLVRVKNVLEEHEEKMVTILKEHYNRNFLTPQN